jgi:ribose transport system substrate-binding protein
MLRSVKVLFILVIILLGFMFAIGCSRQPKPSQQQQILLILKTEDNPFFKSIKDGVKLEIERLGWNIDLQVRSGRQEGDVESQRLVLQNYSANLQSGNLRSLKAVLITPSGSGDELVSYLKAFVDNGIPVLILDTKIDSAALEKAHTKISCSIASDNHYGGRLAAEYICARLKSGDGVLLLNGVDGQETAYQRRSGFREYIDSVAHSLNATYPITERTANWQRADAQSITASFLALNKKFRAIFAANDQMALGAFEAYRTEGADRPLIVGFDAVDEAIAAVNDGRIDATISQDPVLMGSTAIQLLDALTKHEMIPGNIAVPVKLVTK